MIIPSGNGRNSSFNPFTDSPDASVSPRSADYVPELKKNVKSARQQEKEARRAAHAPSVQAAQKFHSDNSSAMNRGATIGSARAGNLTDIGGPVRQMRTATSNSIWNPDVLKQLNQEKDNGEKLKASLAHLKQLQAEKRQSCRNLGIDANHLKDILENGNTSSSSSISRLNASTAWNHDTKVASHQMSIFDNNRDFDRIPEKTTGEQLKEAAQDRRSKKRNDREWAKVSKAASAKDRLSAFLNGQKGN